MHYRRIPRTLVQRLLDGSAILWLLLALVWVPSLGRLHQVAHALPLAGVHAGHAAELTRLQEIASAHVTSDFLPPLLAEHALVDCLLLDQLALADSAPGAPKVLPPLVPGAAPPHWHAEGAVPGHVALFHARGPPPRALG